MTLLYKRDWKVRIETLEFAELDIEFEVSKSLHPEPNSCKLTVYGLKDASRRLVESLNIYDPKKFKGASKTAKLADVQPKAPTAVSRAPKAGKIRVEIEAGYEGARGLIFRGDLRRGLSHYDGAEVTLEIEGEDGGRSILQGRVNKSYPAGTRQITVVKDCAAAMGLGLGNLLAVESKLSGSYDSGTAINGQASAILPGLLRRAGVHYSVQNGVLQFLEAGKGLTTTGYLLSANTGMIGRPRRDATGAVLVDTLMLPNMAPGAYVKLESAAHKGSYFVEGVKTAGSTFGNEWGHELELQPS